MHINVKAHIHAIGYKLVHIDTIIVPPEKIFLDADVRREL